MVVGGAGFPGWVWFAGAWGLVLLEMRRVPLGCSVSLVRVGLLAPVVGRVAVVPGRGRAPVRRVSSGVVRVGKGSFRLCEFAT